MKTALRVALATQHGKEAVIAPEFAQTLGWRVEVVAIDTDAYGTFSGDCPRELGPEATALAKARGGIDASGIPRGLASEGTIGPDPRMPLITADHEILAYVDLEHGTQLTQWHHSADIVAFSHTISAETSWEELARQADLPQHAVIVRNDSQPVYWVRKGLREIDEVRDAVRACQYDTGGPVVVETDYRAMVCPSRQAVIGACAKKLATRLSTPCPQCSTGGWGVVGVQRGLPCRECGTLAQEAIAGEEWGCVSCDHTVVTPSAETVDPARCPRCNP